MFTLTITGKDPKELAEKVSDLGQAMLQVLANQAANDQAAIEASPEKPVKAPKKSETKKAGGDEDDADDFDLTDEGDDDDTETETNPVPAYSLSSVVAKLKEYVKDNSKVEAFKILKKFKVKSVKDLPEEQYSKFVEALQ